MQVKNVVKYCTNNCVFYLCNLYTLDRFKCRQGRQGQAGAGRGRQGQAGQPQGCGIGQGSHRTGGAAGLWHSTVGGLRQDTQGGGGVARVSENFKKTIDKK